MIKRYNESNVTHSMIQQDKERCLHDENQELENKLSRLRDEKEEELETYK